MSAEFSTDARIYPTEPARINGERRDDAIIEVYSSADELMLKIVDGETTVCQFTIDLDPDFIDLMIVALTAAKACAGGRRA